MKILEAMECLNGLPIPEGDCPIKLETPDGPGVDGGWLLYFCSVTILSEQLESAETKADVLAACERGDALYRMGVIDDITLTNQAKLFMTAVLADLEQKGVDTSGASIIVGDDHQDEVE